MKNFVVGPNGFGRNASADNGEPISRAIDYRVIALSAIFALTGIVACGGGDQPAVASDPTATETPAPVTDAGSVTAPEAQKPPAPVVTPTASFARTPTTGSPSLTVQFTDTSEAGSEPVKAWLWDFGDGMTSVDQNPSHTYTTEGTFAVSLRVTTVVGSATYRDPMSVVATIPLPARIIETAAGTGNSPGLPAPLVFNEILPRTSNRKLIGESLVKEFSPHLAKAVFVHWAACRNPIGPSLIFTG